MKRSLKYSQDCEEECRPKVPKYTKNSELPPELLLKVFSWLGPKELYQSVAPVCKRWRELFLDARLWTRLSFHGSEISTEVVCSLLKHSPRLRYLELVERADAAAILDQVHRSNRHITSLRIKRCRGSDKRHFILAGKLINIINHCSQIVELTIKDTQFRSPKLFQMLGSKLPRLKRINFSYHHEFDRNVFHTVVMSYNPLEELNGFRLCGFVVNCDDVKLLTTRMGNTLKVLKINALDITDESMEAIASCPHLTTLCLRYAVHITLVGIMKLVGLEKLTYLEVTMASLVPTQYWCNLFEQAKWGDLTKLGLSHCTHVDDEVLTCISRRFCKLEKLRLSGCILVTDDGLTRVIKQCSKLKYLNVFFTQIYTVRSFPLIPDCCPRLETLVFRPFVFEEESHILNMLKQRLPRLTIYDSDENKRDTYWRSLNFPSHLYL